MISGQSKLFSHSAARWAQFGPSIFTEMTELAKTYGALNLGQGFPDFQGPKRVLDSISSRLYNCHNQYAPSSGEFPLRQQVSQFIKKHTGVFYDPESEITITCGASEALYSTINAFVNPGDKVVVFEPAFDLYYQAIANAGGVVVPVRLHAPDTPVGLVQNGWGIDWNEFNSVTQNGFKLMILNTPHNPTGKVFSEDELDRILAAAAKNSALVVADEVYENLYYDEQRPYVSASAFPATQNLVIRISSAAKTFGFTGLKIGWVTASPVLTQTIRLVHQATVFCVPPMLQLGLADCMEDEAWFYSYLTSMRQEYEKKRNALSAVLERYGFINSPCQGTFFIASSYENLVSQVDDVTFVKQFLESRNIATIPLSPFYKDPPKSIPWIRFAFCKKDETIKAVAQRLFDQT